MQAIRAAVIFMAFLIVGGVALLIYGVMNDWHKKDEIVAEDAEAPALAMPMTAAVSLSEFGDWDVALPQNAVVEEITAEGGRLFIRYNAQPNDGIIVLDLASKKQLGHIHLK